LSYEFDLFSCLFFWVLPKPRICDPPSPTLEGSEVFPSPTANASNFFKSRGPCMGELKYVESNMKISSYARRWYSYQKRLRSAKFICAVFVI